MADLVNLMAESDRDIISDDATPTLTLKNTGTGIALNLLGSTAKEGAVIGNTPTGGATIAALRVAASVASQAVISISGVFMSTASINLSAAQTAFVIPVYHETQKIVGYINVSKGVV